MNFKGRVIVTGASGFIGSSLCKHLKSKNIECLGVSRLASEYTDIKVKSYTETLKYNDNNTILINLAGGNTSILENEIELVIELSNCYKNNMLFFSSAKVYGEKFKHLVDEGEIISSDNDYIRKKISLEKIILDNEGMVARLSNVYGKGMSANNVFYDIHKQVIAKKDKIMIQNLKPIRDFIYISDVCEYIYQILILGLKNLILNLGTGQGTDVKTLFKLICKSINIDYGKLNISSKNSIESKLVLNIELYKKLYGGNPLISIEQGIYNWLNEK